jgi:hypothetical protein
MRSPAVVGAAGSTITNGTHKHGLIGGSQPCSGVAEFGAKDLERHAGRVELTRLSERGDAMALDVLSAVRRIRMPNLFGANASRSRCSLNPPCARLPAPVPFRIFDQRQHELL